MVAEAELLAFEGEIKIMDAMKMSYSINGTMAYGESYKLEYESPERKAALAEAGDDPMADVPPAFLINASFDTSDGGPTMLTPNKIYKLTLTEITE